MADNALSFVEQLGARLVARLILETDLGEPLPGVHDKAGVSFSIAWSEPSLRLQGCGKF
jgi:hypothetical protein